VANSASDECSHMISDQNNSLFFYNLSIVNSLDVVFRSWHLSHAFEMEQVDFRPLTGKSRSLQEPVTRCDFKSHKWNYQFDQNSENLWHVETSWKVHMVDKLSVTQFGEAWVTKWQLSRGENNVLKGICESCHTSEWHTGVKRMGKLPASCKRSARMAFAQHKEEVTHASSSVGVVAKEEWRGN